MVSCPPVQTLLIITEEPARYVHPLRWQVNGPLLLYLLTKAVVLTTERNISGLKAAVSDLCPSPQSSSLCLLWVCIPSRLTLDHKQRHTAPPVSPLTSALSPSTIYCLDLWRGGGRVTAAGVFVILTFAKWRKQQQQLGEISTSVWKSDSLALSSFCGVNRVVASETSRND